MSKLTRQDQHDEIMDRLNILSCQISTVAMQRKAIDALQERLRELSQSVKQPQPEPPGNGAAFWERQCREKDELLGKTILQVKAWKEEAEAARVEANTWREKYRSVAHEMLAHSRGRI